MVTTFVLIMLFWSGDHGSAMSTAEFSSEAKCNAAMEAAAKKMDSTWLTYNHNLYAVCAEK